MANYYPSGLPLGSYPGQYFPAAAPSTYSYPAPTYFPSTTTATATPAVTAPYYSSATVPYTYPAATMLPTFAPVQIAKPKLVYFNGRGRAEIIRLIFVLAGVDYEDVRFKPNADNDVNPSRPNDELMEFKKTGNSVTGQVPYLEIDGQKLCQSLAIARYLARRYGFYGHGDPSQLQIDMVVDTLEDLRVKAIQAMFEKDESKKPAMLKEFAETFIPKYGEALEKFLDKNEFKSGFFVGPSLTLADLFVYDFWSTVMKSNAEAAQPFSKLAALVAKVGSIPPIAAWVAKRPETPF